MITKCLNKIVFNLKQRLAIAYFLTYEDAKNGISELNGSIFNGEELTACFEHESLLKASKSMSSIKKKLDIADFVKTNISRNSKPSPPEASFKPGTRSKSLVNVSRTNYTNTLKTNTMATDTMATNNMSTNYMATTTQATTPAKSVNTRLSLTPKSKIKITLEEYKDLHKIEYVPIKLTHVENHAKTGKFLDLWKKADEPDKKSPKEYVCTYNDHNDSDWDNEDASSQVTTSSHKRKMDESVEKHYPPRRSSRFDAFAAESGRTWSPVRREYREHSYSSTSSWYHKDKYHGSSSFAKKSKYAEDSACHRMPSHSSSSSSHYNNHRDGVASYKRSRTDHTCKWDEDWDAEDVRVVCLK